MKKLFLTLLIVLIALPAFAETITITVTAEEVKAVEGVVVSAQDWLQKAWNGKANKCTDRILTEVTDKNVNKLSKEEKDALIKNTIFKSRVEKDEALNIPLDIPIN